MPLRDHFRPPVSKKVSWEGFHGMWPSTIVQKLRPLLPPGYVAEPRVHLGTFAEIDVTAFEPDESSPGYGHTNGVSGGHYAPALAPTAFETTTVETEPPSEYEYAVQIYDAEMERTLVAAIEIVSPGNKDRPRKRNAFVGKCAALLRQGVSVSIIDLVTVRRFNLFAELMVSIDQPQLGAADGPASVYAASARWGERESGKTLLEVFSRPLVVGQPLPVIPVWLAEDRVLSLDLEPSYEQACRDLSVPGA